MSGVISQEHLFLFQSTGTCKILCTRQDMTSPVSTLLLADNCLIMSGHVKRIV